MKKEGMGYDEEDEVELKVKRRDGVIEWKINGIKRATYCS